MVAAHANTEIEATILRLVAERASITPEDVARALDTDFHPLLGRIRKIAVTLAVQGAIEITRKGRAIPPEEMRGLIRLRRKPADPLQGHAE